jgi:flavin reductase (DIM6/NTAB) family NADH-FMN oxidoreductase RutF
MLKKVPLELIKANRLLNFGPVTLITAKYREQHNVSTVAWVMSVSSNPPLVAIAITNKRFTYDLIKASREFVINIPSVSLKEAVTICGSTSGRELDKFAKAHLTPGHAKKVGAPIVEECFAHLECKVVDEKSVGDHILLVGDVIAAYAEENAIDQHGVIHVEQTTPLLHLGADQFGTVKRV